MRIPDTGAGEKPRSFVVEGKRISVAEIVSQRVEEAFEDEQQRRCFRVKGDDGATYVLSYIQQAGQWYLE